jgi:4-hydroxy 2-oxovalerate aldolase
MDKFETGILDCTLRDGGYVNDWKWGFLRAKAIINNLVRAGVDFVEVGFLRNVSGYDENITTCNRIEELNRLLPKNMGNTRFAAMAMCGNYDITKLSSYSREGIELIRVTAHDYDLDEGLEFAANIKTLGYKVSINPINIMGYSLEQILGIVKKVNAIAPYQFSIVDTFGSMKTRHFEKIAKLCDSELLPSIRLGLHPHSNMGKGNGLAEHFLDYKFVRDITIDASLMGIGRDPGNLELELIADLINDEYGGEYKIEYMLDSIEDHIYKMHGTAAWGYKPAYFLSGRHNLHRNYSEYYIGKGDLTYHDIDTLFSMFDNNKKMAFDKDYADKLYSKYKANNIDDSTDTAKLAASLSARPLLILAPGAALNIYKEQVKTYIAEQKPIVIAVNFIPPDYETDYLFFGNARRYQMFGAYPSKVIVTSNFAAENCDYRLNYVKLFKKDDKFVNSILLLLRFLASIGIQKVSLAGADGFAKENQNYFDEYIWSSQERSSDINAYTSDVLYSTGVKLSFLTPSLYEKKG